MLEEWRGLPGFEDDYEVSSAGRVRTRPKPKAVHTDRQGRKFITVTRDGKTKTIYVHTAVAGAFIGPRPKGKLVCHGDGNPANNSKGNLRYDTHASNMLDRDNHGRTVRGEDQKRSKLTNEDVTEIKRRLSLGEKQIPIAAHYGVSQRLISMIKTGRLWKHVEYRECQSA
ncbi:NUMOD4 motif-containing HNH endonuclease [Sphingomonas melonis]|uniref:NUMOD4 motif-containing HNH endonuclease n=1 Tax=Sphingomonas melonis TaxID=152682 RepID=UPI0035C83E22